MKLVLIFISLVYCSNVFSQAELPPWAVAQYAYPAQHTIEIDSTRLGECLALATIEVASIPTIWRNHMVYGTADPKGRRSTGPNPYREGRFMRYLQAGPSMRDRQYATGREHLLRNWIFSRSDNSIDPYSLFRESISLNRGNIWNALLTIHQLLRNESRWWATKYYNYNSNYNYQKAFFDKFIDIRGDLRERGGEYTGDHGGTWYRIWGIMLNRFMRLSTHSWVEQMRGELQGGSAACGSLSVTQEMQLALDDFRTQSVAVLAEVYKVIGFEDEDDWRKAEINLAGARIAGSMIRALYLRRIAVTEEDCRNSEFYLY